MEHRTNLEDITKKLNKELAEHEYFMELWQGVSYPTKKNGEPFAILSKNIEGATVKAKDFAYYAYEKELRVGGFCNGCGYIFDSINLYWHTRYMKNAPTKTQNYIEDDLYVLDLDDIKEAVKERTEYHRAHAETLRKQIKNAEKAYTDFYKAYHKALEKLAKDTDKDADSSLYWAVLGH